MIGLEIHDSYEPYYDGRAPRPEDRPEAKPLQLKPLAAKWPQWTPADVRRIVGKPEA